MLNNKTQLSMGMKELIEFQNLTDRFFSIHNETWKKNAPYVTFTKLNIKSFMGIKWRSIKKNLTLGDQKDMKSFLINTSHTRHQNSLQLALMLSASAAKRSQIDVSDCLQKLQPGMLVAQSELNKKRVLINLHQDEEPMNENRYSAEGIRVINIAFDDKTDASKAADKITSLLLQYLATPCHIAIKFEGLDENQVEAMAKTIETLAIELVFNSVQADNQENKDSIPLVSILSDEVSRQLLCKKRLNISHIINNMKLPRAQFVFCLDARKRYLDKTLNKSGINWVLTDMNKDSVSRETVLVPADRGENFLPHHTHQNLFMAAGLYPIYRILFENN